MQRISDAQLVVNPGYPRAQPALFELSPLPPVPTWRENWLTLPDFAREPVREYSQKRARIAEASFLRENA
jgi:hypothetical protein